MQFRGKLAATWDRFALIAGKIGNFGAMGIEAR